MLHIEELIKQAEHICTDGIKLSRAVVDKKWGKEYIIIQSPHACKIMTLEPGGICSTHFHRDKSESFILISGQLEVTIYSQAGKKETFVLDKPFSSVTIAECRAHTFRVPENVNQIEPTVFIEASTEDKASDSYRITQSQGR